MTTGRFVAPLTAAMRMVDRVHNGAPHRWTHSHMAFTPGFTNGDIAMIRIANLANSCAAAYQHPAHF
jgi:hypothetical protein